MSGSRDHGGLITLCLLLSCRLVVALDAASNNPAPLNPAFNGSPESPFTSSPNANASTPALMALPANVGNSTDSSTSTKFYTLSASLREIYDDNVNTSDKNPIASFETQLSPSVLVDFPMENSNFSARYTLGLTYYSDYNGGNQSNGNNNNNKGNGGGGSLDYTHEFVAQYSHSFSDLFILALAEQFRYYTDPSIFESTGTLYRNGSYVSNSFNGSIGAQWTPLFGTTTTYANTTVRYDEAAVAFAQDNEENTASQTFSFAVLPKINASFGAILDDITYDHILRGYTSYTGFLGMQWQALPSLSFTGRGGASYTEKLQDPSRLSPSAALSADWILGKRSGLSFNYSHEVTPSDQVGANGQTSDRVTGNFRYDILTNLSTHLQLIFTEAEYTNLLTKTSNLNSNYNETDYGVDTGVAYLYNI